MLLALFHYEKLKHNNNQFDEPRYTGCYRIFLLF